MQDYFTKNLIQKCRILGFYQILGGIFGSTIKHTKWTFILNFCPSRDSTSISLEY